MGDVLSQISAALAERYALERELGRGGMATVYLARDLHHDRPVALKVLHPELAATLGPERFLREIRLAARLQHPHILSVHDSGEAAGQLWFTMPYVEGETLRDRLRREKQLPISDALRITQEVADALDYAHRHGVVHRDVKPENILLTERHAMVADFGVARALGADEIGRLTETGMALGTPAYMSPEQATGERELDGRTDVYSLGCVLYEMVVGEPPFTGPTPQAVLAKRFIQSATRVGLLREGVPGAVEEAVSRALARLPVDRFATAAQFMDALTSPPSGAAAPQGKSEPPAVTRRRARQRTATASVLILAAASLVWIVSQERPRPDARAPESQPGADPRHIAVLYFEDVSQGGDLRYLADGLTEELIKELSKVRPLDVISKNGVLPYREDSIPLDSLARALNVGTLVAGSVEDMRQSVRINVRLVDGASGADFRRASFGAPKNNPLAARDTLARQVSRFLRERLGEEVRVQRQREGTRNADAWALVQRAEVSRKRADSLSAAGDTVSASHEVGVGDSLLARAVALDPNWSDPIVLRGMIAYGNSRSQGADPEHARPWIERGLSYAEKALRLQPKHADALELRGTLRYWQWLVQLVPDPAGARKLLRAAQEDLEAATQVNPTQAGAWSALSHLYYQTSGEAAAKLAALRAYEADAYLGAADQILWRLFISSYDLDELTEASRWCDEGGRRFPGHYRFVECQLLIMGTPGRAPDVAVAWELIRKAELIVPKGIRSFTQRKWRTLAAIVLTRAGLADSARRVIETSRADSVADPLVELPYWEARAYIEIGDRTAAIRSLATYAAADAQRKAEIVDDTTWSALRKDPLFKKLFAN